MAKKKNNSILQFIGIQLLAAIVLVVVLVGIVIYQLDIYTQHGIEAEVPSVVGLSRSEAQQRLTDAQMQMVIVDSVYNRTQPLGHIVEQHPTAGSHVKVGRHIYVTINSNTRRQFAMPNLRDISRRQAEATLQSLQLKVMETLYEPSEFKELVLDVRRMDGEPIEPGEMVSEGTEVAMVVGFGQGTEQVYVPNLLGMNLRDARQALMAQYLIIGSVSYDNEEEEDGRKEKGEVRSEEGETENGESEDEWVIYEQSIVPNARVREGSRVDVTLTREVEKAVRLGNESDKENEDFF